MNINEIVTPNHHPMRIAVLCVVILILLCFPLVRSAQSQTNQKKQDYIVTYMVQKLPYINPKGKYEKTTVYALSHADARYSWLKHLKKHFSASDGWRVHISMVELKQPHHQRR